jgi:hypothetical protein
MDRMYARILPAIALALLLFAGDNRLLLAQGISVAPGPGDQQPQANPCQVQFTSLRDELQNRGQGLQAAGKRKASPKELCTRITGYAASESKMLNFLQKKAQECGIPPDAADGLRKNMAKTAELRTRICSNANAPGPAQQQSPSSGLSGALNQNTGTVPEAPTGGGIFDTLSGNILQQ